MTTNHLSGFTDAELTAELARRHGVSTKPPTSDLRTWRPEFVDVPAGAFLMGSSAKDAEAVDNEKPQHKLKLPRFLIGHTPVTVGHWKHYLGAARVTPGDARCTSSPDDHPVTYVSHVEAAAYCTWLTGVLKGALAADLHGLLRKGGKYSVALPSEEQWEKAARGTDGRIYPWGNVFDLARLNCSDSGVGRTTPVDAYPGGASACGALDMAGNVWEWCSSPWDRKYPLTKKSKGDPTYKVVRGGSFFSNRRRARCAFRGSVLPEIRSAYIGFRAALSPFPSDL